MSVNFAYKNKYLLVCLTVLIFSVPYCPNILVGVFVPVLVYLFVLIFCVLLCPCVSVPYCPNI